MFTKRESAKKRHPQKAPAKHGVFCYNQDILMTRKSGNKEAKMQEALTRGVEDAIERAHLEAALRSGRKLRVKLGIDPTAANLHLGHAVVLGKLRQFQDLGHKAVLIIGDFTATIGDPSGRSEARAQLTPAQVEKNMQKYLAQASKVIDLKKAEVRHNSEWHAKQGGLLALLELTKAATVQQVLKRQDFAARLKEDKDITLLETLYPLLQGYDSVAVKADVELGGTDQLLNVLMGRKVQRHYKVPEQDILTVSLMEGLDGSKKMSKSVGNVVDMLDEPEDMFGKIMTLPDALIIRWFTLGTVLPVEEIKKFERDLASGKNPKGTKERLAFEIVKRYHGEKPARSAAEKFEKVFAKKDLSGAEVPELKVKKGMNVVDLVMASGVAASKSEARRLVGQGAVSLDDKAIKDWNMEVDVSGGEILKVGKRHFFRMKI